MSSQDSQRESIAWTIIALGFYLMLYGEDHTLKYCVKSLKPVIELILGAATLITGFIVVCVAVRYLIKIRKGTL